LVKRKKKITSSKDWFKASNLFTRSKSKIEKQIKDLEKRVEDLEEELFD